MTDTGFNPFAGGELLRVGPSTQPQREVIASSQMAEEANIAFNEGVAVAITGKVDVETFQRSFDALIARHEVFRSTFSRKGDEICLQSDLAPSLSFDDKSSCSESEQKQYLEQLYKDIVASPMNLEDGPLIHAWLIKLSDQSYSLVVAAHHVICDGWTFGLLLTELAEIYRSNGSTDGMAPAPSFFDYAEQQSANQVSNRDVDFWRDKFRDIPPTTDIPTDKPRPASRSFDAKRFDYTIDKALTDSLKKVAIGEKASLVNVVLSAYFVLLHRLTNINDLIVGLPVAGQAAMNQLGMAGHMVQLLPIRVQLAPEQTFSELVSVVKSEVVNASAHPNFTFGELVKGMKLDRSRVPLISTIFNIDQEMPPLDFGAAEGILASLPRAAENFEMFLNVVPNENGLLIETTYSTALFEESSILSWMGALQNILEQLTNSTQVAIKQLRLGNSIPANAELANATSQSVSHSSVLDMVLDQADKTPDAEALVFGDTRYSYQALAAKLGIVAGALSQAGVKAGDSVGICCARSDALVLLTLASHWLGASYLPLDPAFPADRLRYMLEDSGTKFVVGDENASRIFADKTEDIDLLDFDSVIGSNAPPATKTMTSSDSRAYTIYTSGSTGKPKGVCISFGAMANFIDSMIKAPGFESDDRLLAVTTLAFDISVLELFAPLCSGATVVVASDSHLKEGSLLAEQIESENVSVMQATPATWRLLLESNWGQSKHARFKALCGGEPLPEVLADNLLDSVSELWNMFGPTETTVWSTCKKIERPLNNITVGKPIQNTQVYVLDEANSPSPVSVPGEICIGGAGLAMGYHQRPELTVERFVDHPDFGRIYRTGDLGKWTESGELQHMGRLDDQVKVRGYRIELGEIETAINDLDLTGRAVAYLWVVGEGDVRIVACCVPKEGQGVQTAALRKGLRDRLPTYMVPQYFLPIDEIPLTPNGKVDRRALPRPELAASSLVASELIGETEKAVANLWASILQTQVSIGRNDSFFDIGGHSLLALEVVRQIEDKYGIKLTMKDMVSQKLYGLAEAIDASVSVSSNDQLPSDDAAPTDKQPKKSFLRRLFG